MNRLATATLIAVLAAVPTTAFAQTPAPSAMKHDAMKHNSMSHAMTHTMQKKPTAMNHGSMSHDSMTHAMSDASPKP